jgi:hypothetical protein
MRPSVTIATLVAGVLQVRQRRGQRVQFRHAVGARALEADHGDEVAVQLAGLVGVHEVFLRIEGQRRRFDDVVFLLDGRDFHHGAAQVALHQDQAAVRAGTGW